MNEKQYETILGLLANKIQEQEDTISYQKLRIEILEQKVKDAEQHIR